MSDMNRRQFLKAGLSSLAYFTLEQTTPQWIMKAANAVPINCLTSGRILVILQQSGGNDGLNTLVPYSDAAYAAARPNIKIPTAELITLDSLNGLHPKMTGIANWFQAGNAAAIQCVGYANPNFSHFTSTDYWETGTAPGQPLPNQGWVSKFYDNTCNGHGDPDALFMATTGITSQPDMMAGSLNYVPPSIGSASSYSLRVNNSTTGGTDRVPRTTAISNLNNMVPPTPDIDFLQRSTNTVQASIADVQTANGTTLVNELTFTNNSLGNGLKMAAKIIKAGFNTRVFYVSQGGYDTHANQIISGQVTTAGDHQKLLADLSVNVDAFLKEMQSIGRLKDVLIITFSEFGRRIAENGSSGTDHGAANVLFAFGGGVNAGIYGGQPNLTNTINGNLRHSVDFRTVYSGIIQNWFGGDAAAVFGQATYDSIIGPQLANVNFVNAKSNIRNWNQY